LDVDETFVAGIWWRHIPAGGDVLYEPPDPADGRWQRGAVVEALYFGDSDTTVWAEWYRWLAEAGLPPRMGLPRDLWRWRISLPRVADLSTHDRLARVGLSPPSPGRVDWPRFQRVGEALHHAGWPALLAPSASRPDDGLVLCAFRTTRDVAGAVPLPPPTTVDDPPVVPTGLRT
jgi:RES domain-containing protein